jgi:hypothetical protein
MAHRSLELQHDDQDTGNRYLISEPPFEPEEAVVIAAITGGEVVEESILHPGQKNIVSYDAGSLIPDLSAIRFARYHLQLKGHTISVKNEATPATIQEFHGFKNDRRS